MKVITYPRCLFALSVLMLLTVSACSEHSSQTDTSSASAPVATAPSPAAQRPTSEEKAADQPDEADENGEAKREREQSAAGSYGPRIKGVALGQSPAEVRRALSALLPIGNPCQVSADAVRVVCEGTAQQLQGTFTYESGKLSGFKFYSYLSSVAFGGMSFNDFTSNFMKAYDIPRMDPAQDNPMFSQYLRYRDDSGWEAGIYPDNTFYVKSVATASQQAKSFN